MDITTKAILIALAILLATVVLLLIWNSQRPNKPQLKPYQVAGVPP